MSVAYKFLISENEAYRSLYSFQVSEGVVPDNIPNRLLKDFATKLAPMIRDIYNQSLREGYIPSLLKSSIVSVLPKVIPPKAIESDLRPISLTCTLAKVMEDFTCSRLIPLLDKKIDHHQYTRKGHSTTDTLLYILQAVYEAVDSGEVSARLFFIYFTKVFVLIDLIDHTILMQELAKLEVYPVFLKSIAAFLTNRQQAVRIGGTLSDCRPLKGGVPQGTKLGVMFLTFMTNQVLSNRHLRIKFVDDTTALEMISRKFILVCSMSLLRISINSPYPYLIA